MHAPSFGNPYDEDRFIMEFRPPLSRIPIANTAPNFTKISSLLLAITSSILFLNFSVLGSTAPLVYYQTIAIPIYAPYLTKSVVSLSKGSNISRASLNCVPAHAIPRAKAVPYLTCGLYERAKSFITLGIYSY